MRTSIPKTLRSALLVVLVLAGRTAMAFPQAQPTSNPGLSQVPTSSAAPMPTSVATSNAVTPRTIRPCNVVLERLYSLDSSLNWHLYGDPVNGEYTNGEQYCWERAVVCTGPGNPHFPTGLLCQECNQ